MKKRIFFVLFLIIFVNNRLNIFAEEAPQEMQRTYYEIGDLNPRWFTMDISKYSISIWNDKKVLTLSTPGGIDKIIDHNGNINKVVNGEYRYLGYNVFGYLINNPDYPDDHAGREVINNYKWLLNQEQKLSIAPYIATPEDASFYKKEIFYFLENEYGVRFNEKDDPNLWLARARVIVPVSEYGRGVIRFVHEWDSDKNGIPEEWYITVNLRAKREVPGWNLSFENHRITPIKYLSENIDSTVELRSNLPSQELFDADIAIPTGESLYAKLRLKEYISNIEFTKNEGSMDYDVIVTKRYRLRRWNSTAIQIDVNGDGDFLDPEDVVQGDWEYDGPYTTTKSYPITRHYSYYTVSNLGIYSLIGASIQNEALPKGELRLYGSVVIPTIELKTYSFNEHVFPLLPGTEKYIDLGTEIVGGGSDFPSIPDEDFSAIANASLGEFSVRNDQLIFNGVHLLRDNLVDTQGVAPLSIPDAPLCSEFLLFENELIIPNTVKNGRYSTTGQAEYKAVPIAVTGTGTEYMIQTGQKNMAITTLENVIVHTPVVCNPTINQISKETQQILVNEMMHQLVLEETFQIEYPTLGTHIHAKGYGYRDYNAYVQAKQVQFPFDVYVGSDYSGIYLPKNTWGNFNSLERTFFIPSWSKEGTGHILFRTIPKNIPHIDDPNFEYKANLSLLNYKAVEALSYNLSGKIGDFSITDCRDDEWLDFFAKRTTTNDPSDALPLLPGTQYKNGQGISKSLNGVMLGYPINFSVKTNGNLKAEKDFIFIQPKYSYVPIINGKIDMTKRQEVELYQSSATSMKKIEKSFALGNTQRKWIGQKAAITQGVTETEKVESVQLWEGKFFLPNMTYCVPKGTNLSTIKTLDVAKSPFLRNGYIIVSFDMYAYKDIHSITKEILFDPLKIEAFLKRTIDLQTRKKQNLAEYLDYGNGWLEDGYNTIQLGLILQPGDILFYSTELRASQTYY